MKKHAHDHKAFMNIVKKQFGALLDYSEQAMYVYLDDHHNMCNKRFAAMLGYKPTQLAPGKDAFSLDMVEVKSQKAIISAYRNAMEKGICSTISVTWLKKGGSKVRTRVTLVPVPFEGQIAALHFISKI